MGYIEIEDTDRLSQVGDVLPGDMSDDEILDAMVHLVGEAKAVEQQLEDHKSFPREDGWEIRARTARRHMVRKFEKLRSEAILRSIPNLPDIDQEREQARLDRVARWENARLNHDAAMLVKEGKALAAVEGQVRHAQLVLEHARTKQQHEAERTARHIANRQAEAAIAQGKSGMFLKAARALLPKDQLATIWNKAIEMFPDDPAWLPAKKANDTEPCP